MPTTSDAAALRAHRVVVGMAEGFRDAAGESLRERLREDIGIAVDSIAVVDVYTVEAAIDADDVSLLARELFADPIMQASATDVPFPVNYDYVIEVGFLPGVTDNVGRSAAQGVADVIGRALGENEGVYKSTQYFLRGTLDADVCERIAREGIANGLIERWVIRSSSDGLPESGGLLDVPRVTEVSDVTVHAIDLEIEDAALMQLSRDGLLALELDEMRAVQTHYRRKDVRARRAAMGLPDGPTDVELEVIAQTWSEHCKHKIFAATIDYTAPDGVCRTIDGLFKNYVKATTDTVSKKVDWLVSVFHDNAGIVRFDEQYDFALKAETHNSPSALDPYGGAMTGIVGVNRDILGAGMGCRCLFNTDVFCVGSPEYDGDIPARLFHPKRVLRGVHRGVQDGGNESGIPNVNGAIVFHERFLGKPLVFCGTGGMIPREVAGHPSHEKGARPGDRIVMVGGRIGKDGIHGATFSSEELHEGSPATAVQIGAPITQKKMADFLLEARDLGLFTCITDNGAGGLSSSIGEMARTPGGCAIHLDRAPLKYAGLAPWEIFVSEAQERMSLSVAPEQIDAFMTLAARREVEATDLGEFTDSGYLECLYGGGVVASLEMEFLHEGVPTMQLRAELSPQKPAAPIEVEESDLTQALKNVLGTLNVCSKESFVRMYDHEVQGQSVLKQFQGVEMDGPGDAAVLRPVPGSNRGLAVACGLAPKYSDLDTYAMMAASIDETVRNLVCVGTQLGTIAGLDNFCWPDPVESEKTPDGAHKLAQLVRCCEALYDGCVAYDIPLISGKDSMKNDYKIGDTKISIPPTVLFTGAAVMEDVTRAVSMDAKCPGDAVYVVGETFDELGGSEYLLTLGMKGGVAPRVDFARARRVHEAVSGAIQRGLIASCHDCSDGGLAVALAETAFAGGLGMDLDLHGIPLDSDVAALFSESQARYVVTVSPDRVSDLETVLQDVFFTCLGEVTPEPRFRLRTRGHERIDAPIADLKQAWQRPLDW